MRSTEVLPALPELPPGFPPQGQWTYEDYCRLPDDGRRYEVIRGVLYMSPSPRSRHQAVIAFLTARLYAHNEKRGLGKMYPGPIDVMLGERASPAVPDLVFVAKKRSHTIGERFIDGPPDLVIEVLSPSNPRHDRKTKFEVYAEAGVCEYWIVDLLKQEVVEVYGLDAGKYVLSQRAVRGDRIVSRVVDGFEVDMTELCEQD